MLLGVRHGRGRTGLRGCARGTSGASCACPRPLERVMHFQPLSPGPFPRKQGKGSSVPPRWRGGTTGWGSGDHRASRVACRVERAEFITRSRGHLRSCSPHPEPLPHKEGGAWRGRFSPFPLRGGRAGEGGKGGRTTSQTASEFRRDTQVNQDRGNRLSTFTGSARGLTSYLVPNHKIPSPVLVMALASRRGRWCGSLASRSSEYISTCRTRESYHREQGRFRAGRRFGCCGPIQTHSPHPA